MQGKVATKEQIEPGNEKFLAYGEHRRKVALQRKFNPRIRSKILGQASPGIDDALGHVVEETRVAPQHPLGALGVEFGER